MIFLRSTSMPGTLRGVDPVATMISFVAASDCLPPSVQRDLDAEAAA